MMFTTDWLEGRPAPLPKNEDERLLALAKYLPDSDESIREREFDRLASFAARICDIPVSFINLIGKNHEYKKACYGYAGKTTPREMSFCQYTIMQDEILEIKDTRKHELFRRNPNVMGNLGVRYYAGIPLKCSAGFNAGTLCLMDFRPNELTLDQKAVLQTLSEEIISRFELNAAQKKLETLNREKDELIKIVSHDMRNPLIGIIGFSEYLINEIENTEHREILELVEDAGKSMLGLINLSLNSGYINHQSTCVNLSKTDAVDITELIIRLHRPYALLKNLDITLDLPRTVLCKLDSEKWKQIVANLLSNAIKFTPSGGTIFVSLSKSESLPKTIKLTITDSGIGMTEEIIQNLFKPEDSIRRTGTNGEESTGLGMRLVKKNVDLLRGFIQVDSAPDKGSSITVNIPI